MKGYLRIRYALYLAILIFCGVSVRKGIMALCAQQKFICICDQHIAHVERIRVATALRELFEHNELCADSLTMDVRERFPFIKSFTLSYLPGVTCCSLKSRNPFCLINDVLVLTDDGILVTKNVFEPLVVAPLRTAYVDHVAIQKEHAICGFQECIAQLPTAILDVYDVMWYDRLHAQLRDKKEKKFSILFDVNTLPNEHILKQCKGIKDELVERNLYQQSRRLWFADIRFAKQIIVFEDKGGSWYG